MSNWILAVVLGLQAHFAASYLVPLDKQSQGEFGGLLRWVWPWSDGDGGLLGRLTTGGDLPLPGLWLALFAASLYILAALAAIGLWVPSKWLRPLMVAGAACLACLTVLFFGPTKLLPAAVALATLYVALMRPALLGAE
jgi:hypothetical protein